MSNQDPQMKLVRSDKFFNHPRADFSKLEDLKKVFTSPNPPLIVTGSPNGTDHFVQITSLESKYAYKFVLKPDGTFTVEIAAENPTQK